VRDVLFFSMSVRDVRAARGITFLLYAKERVIYRHAALFSYMWRYGVQRRGVGGRPGGPCSGPVVVACPVLEQGRLRGCRRSGWP
jgi:hypothetical protein